MWLWLSVSKQPEWYLADHGRFSSAVVLATNTSKTAYLSVTMGCLQSVGNAESRLASLNREPLLKQHLAIGASH